MFERKLDKIMGYSNIYECNVFFESRNIFSNGSTKIGEFDLNRFNRAAY
jgi:hypothetical protein